MLYPYKGIVPRIHPSVYIAPGGHIIGDVSIGEMSSLWFNSVVRGDVNSVSIGSFTNIQDGAVLHVTGDIAPLNIGDKVTIGHLACLHGCTVHSLSLIGIGAVVLDGAVVETLSMVAAGAVVTPGFTVPSGKLVAGTPAKVIRDLKPSEIAYFETSAMHYAGYANEMKKNSIGK